MTPDLLIDLRNLGVAVGCILSASAVAGWVTAEWRSMRDDQTGRNQPRPVWSAEERWGGR